MKTEYKRIENGIYELEKLILNIDKVMEYYNINPFTIYNPVITKYGISKKMGAFHLDYYTSHNINGIMSYIENRDDILVEDENSYYNIYINYKSMGKNYYEAMSISEIMEFKFHGNNYYKELS